MVPVVVLGVAAGIVAEFTLNRRPEPELARSFLLSQKEIVEEFGRPLSVSFKREGQRVSFSIYSRRVEGACRFNVRGSKRSGTVTVLWRNERSGDGFTVTKVEVLRRGEKPEVIWPVGED